MVALDEGPTPALGPPPQCNPMADFVVCLPDTSFPSLLMAFYSYVPILLFFVCLTLFIANRTVSSFMATFLFVVSVVFGEILKQIIRQKRPDGTCACSTGMPSGHSLISIEFLAWILLEMLFEYKPINKAPLKPLHKALIVIVALVLFVPVPYSRVYLLYHTPLQATIGSLIGLTLAVGWFTLLQYHIVPKGLIEKWSKSRGLRWLRMRNDYRPPVERYGTLEENQEYDNV